MTKRRFEQVTATPVHVIELEERELSVVVHDEAALPASSTFATAAELRRFVDDAVAGWRARGFVEIKRLAAIVPDEPVRREERFEWDDVGGRCGCELMLDGLRLRITRWKGPTRETRDRTGDVQRAKTLALASELWTRTVELIRAEIDAAPDRIAAHAAAQAAGIARERRLREIRHRRDAHPALEHQCRAALPEETGPWSVYADWLIARGDATGEAAARALAGDDAAACDALRAAFPELAETAYRVEFELRRGFIRHLELQRDDEAPPLDDLLARVLRLPCCRFVASVRLGLDDPRDTGWARSLAALVEAPQAPHVTELRLDHYDSTHFEISWTAYGDLAFAWPRMPALELLHVRAGGSGNLAPLALPRLTTLIRESGGLRRGELAAVLDAPPPRLRHLELWTGSSYYGAELELADLAPILDGARLLALAHLGIVNSELSDALIPALVESPVLARLESLDLSNGIAASAFANALVANAARFRHLASIDIAGNLLDERDVARIRAVLDNAITHPQRADDEEQRYVAVGE